MDILNSDTFLSTKFFFEIISVSRVTQRLSLRHGCDGTSVYPWSNKLVRFVLELSWPVRSEGGGGMAIPGDGFEFQQRRAQFQSMLAWSSMVHNFMWAIAIPIVRLCLTLYLGLVCV